jgi:DNA-directed RNA polymerase subunit alpha
MLQNDNIVFVGDLVQKTEAAIMWSPDFERALLNEIKEALANIGLHLGMAISDWPPENIEYAMQQLKMMDERSS